MSVRLVLESAPGPQAVTERAFAGGQMVIGRGDDADWPLDDPENYISRRHCILTLEDGQVMVADVSSGGLYVDNGAHPVGSGNRVPVEPGMRLRMGDFVFRVEATSSTTTAPAERNGGSDFSFDFGSAPPAPVPSKRPDSLPDPFGVARSSRSHGPSPVVAPPRPLEQEDPFALDLRVPRSVSARAPREASGHEWFTSVADKPAPQPDPDAGPDSSPALRDPFDDWSASTATPRDEPEDELARPPEPEAEPEPFRTARPAPPQPGADPVPPPPSDDAAVFAALLNGLGLDPDDFTNVDPLEGAAQIGASMKAMTEGVILLLRTRAMNKQKARVAQTIIASANVNPLKFLATPEDVLSAMLQPKSRSYLTADAAVAEAFRDLTDHQLRSWSAIQTALRRMIDKFDPEGIESEMAEVGLLEQLVAGGRAAKLWQLYEDRYRKIARAAEQEFLGEVGADFRDGYET